MILVFHFYCFRFNKTAIRWTKDSSALIKTRKIKISKKGALRVMNVTYRDAGIYSCHAGHSQADLRLTVKPKPGEIQPNYNYDNYDEEDDEDSNIEGSARERSKIELNVDGTSYPGQNSNQGYVNLNVKIFLIVSMILFIYEFFHFYFIIIF